MSLLPVQNRRDGHAAVETDSTDTGESLWGLHSKAVHETARDPEQYLRSKAASKDGIFIYTSSSFTH